MCVVCLEHHSLVPVFRPCIPAGRSRQAVCVGVEGANEAGPIRLDDRHNSGIGCAVAGRSSAINILGAPDRVDFHSVCYTIAFRI